MVERLGIAVGKACRSARSNTPLATSLARITSRPLVLAMVPATSASSTIDSRLSVSTSVVVCRSIHGPDHGAHLRAAQGKRHGPRIRASAARSRPCRRTAGCWPRSTRAGRSARCRDVAKQPRPDPRRGAAVEGDGAELGIIAQQIAQSGYARHRGSRRRRCPRAGRRRPRPTGRCRAPAAARAGRHSRGRAGPRRSPTAEQPPELVGRIRVIAGPASEASPGRLPRMNSRAIGSAIGGSPDLTLNKITPTAQPGEAERSPHRPLFGQLQLCARRCQPGAEPAGRLSAAPGRPGPHLFADCGQPGFPATGDLVNVPSVADPGPGRISRAAALPAPASSATSSNSIPTWSTSPAPTSSATAR